MKYEVLKNWRKRNPDKVSAQHRRWKLKRFYGMSVTDYNKLFEKQDGRCAICKMHQSNFSKRLYVDHDHDTGEVRGLLCQKCNHAIGLFNDDVEILKSAVEYIGGVA